MMSKQYQVFGANPKIGLRKKECSCRALTWHILSQDFKRVSLRLQPPIPKAEYFSLDQFSELNSSGYYRENGLSGYWPHTHVEKGAIEKDFATTKKKTHLL